MRHICRCLKHFVRPTVLIPQLRSFVSFEDRSPTIDQVTRSSRRSKHWTFDAKRVGIFVVSHDGSAISGLFSGLRELTFPAVFLLSYLCLAKILLFIVHASCPSFPRRNRQRKTSATSNLDFLPRVFFCASAWRHIDAPSLHPLSDFISSPLISILEIL